MRGLVILVPGLPGIVYFDNYWESALDSSIFPSNLDVKSVNPCPIGSHHDRACEIYAQITGTKVDYGLEHSTKYKHNQYGRNYQEIGPIHKKWNSLNPIHFVCHSSSINTVRILQKLLNIDFWKHDTNSNWIISIISINGVFNNWVISNVLEKDLLNSVNKNNICTHCNVDNKTFCIHHKMIKAGKILISCVLWIVKNQHQTLSKYLKTVLDWPLEHWNTSSVDTKDVNNIESDEQLIQKFKNFKNCPIFLTEDNIIFEHFNSGYKQLSMFLNGNYENSKKYNDKPEFLYSNTYYLCFFSFATNVLKLDVPSEISPILWPFSSVLLEGEIDTPNKNVDQSLLEKISFISGSSNPLKDNDGLTSLYDQCVPDEAEAHIEFFPLKTNQLQDNEIDINNIFTTVKPATWYIENIQNWITFKSNNVNNINIDSINNEHNQNHVNSSYDYDGGDNGSNDKTSERVKIWDHLDVCWARTFLKYKKDQMPLFYQLNFFKNLFLYLSLIELKFRNTCN